MKKGIYIIAALLLTACGETESEDIVAVENEAQAENQETQIEEPLRVKRDSIHPEVKPEAPVKLSTYSATWFQVDYPENFTASPSGPMQIYGDDYEFVETEEAKFTSPDGTVEFFVFSPQWGGDPIDYLIEQPNEKTVDQSEDKANSDDPFAASHHWVTYEDKEGKYTRSYHSIMTENTHHVFGVKYTTRKMYERYKAAYLAFKKSLQQFAD
ncbi:MAG: hypothetical protein P8P74_11675 [Crocinitomicaceae bacterium]|nr:hypothetical protein [Crocinitomicaceae bacterium]